MPKTILPGRKTAKKSTHKPTPDSPVSVWVSGSFNAVDLAKRLSRGGLMLSQDKRGRVSLVLSHSEHPPTATAREHLFQAVGIIESVRLALATNLEAKDVESTASNALQAANCILDNVACELGSVS
jgi:hypothetical protein